MWLNRLLFLDSEIYRLKKTSPIEKKLQMEIEMYRLKKKS